MNLIIKNPNQDILEEFIDMFVIPEIYIYFMKNIDSRYLKIWDTYFEDKYNWGMKNTPQGAFEIMVQGITSLNCSKSHNGDYIISINPNKIMSGTNAKLYDLCALINYGCLEMSPYPIFEKTFNHVAQLLPNLFEEYVNYLRSD